MEKIIIKIVTTPYLIIPIVAYFGVGFFMVMIGLIELAADVSEEYLQVSPWRMIGILILMFFVGPGYILCLLIGGGIMALKNKIFKRRGC